MGEGKAKKYGEVIIGLLTDKAIAKYKSIPLINYETRELIVKNLKNVSKVLRVYVVDPFEQSLKVAKERYDVIEQVDTNEVSYHTSMSEIDSNTIFDI